MATLTAQAPNKALLPKELPPRSPFGYRALLVFSFLYYFHPDDIVPGLGALHLARITSGLIIGALILSAHKLRPNSLPLEVKLILAMFAWMILGIPFAYWRGGSFVMVFMEFSKVVMVAVTLSITVTRFTELRLLILIQALSVAFMTIASVIVNNRDQGRLAGIGNALLSNPNDLAMNIVLNWPLCLVLFFTCRGVLKKSFWALSMVVMVYAVTATYSRAGFLALSLAIVICLWDFGVRGKRAYMLAGAFLCLMAAILVAPNNYAKRLQTLVGHFQEGDLDRGSAEQRENLLVKSLQVTASHPIFGVGAGNFQAYTQSWLVTHNTYTQFTSECGIPILFLFLLLLWRAFKNVRLVRKMPKANDVETMRLYASALQASLAAYVLGAFFSSTAYVLFPYYIVMYTVLLSRLVSPKPQSDSNRPSSRSELRQTYRAGGAGNLIAAPPDHR